jgi:hypothetical protein
MVSSKAITFYPFEESHVEHFQYEPTFCMCFEKYLVDLKTVQTRFLIFMVVYILCHILWLYIHDTGNVIKLPTPKKHTSFWCSLCIMIRL